MPQHELAPDVQAFLDRHIRTLEHLEVLMLVSNTPDRWWDAGSVARELGMGEGGARRALDHLGSRNLLEIRITGDVRYQYRPGADDLHAGVQALRHAYRHNRVVLLTTVAGTSPRRGVRDFADAFRIRRHDDR